jgi:tRNA(fMet)-specific endonuclease VapC
MGDSICLDTDFLIDFLRNKKEAVDWIKENELKSELSTTTINIFELFTGAHKSTNPEQKIKLVNELIDRLLILNLSIKSSEFAGKERARLEKEGNMIDNRDLLIGAIASTERVSLKTNNRKHLDRITGLDLV